MQDLENICPIRAPLQSDLSKDKSKPLKTFGTVVKCNLPSAPIKPEKESERRVTEDTCSTWLSQQTTSSSSSSSQKPSLTKWQYQPCESECDSSAPARRRNSRVFGLPIECEGLDALARSHLDRALADGRVEVTIVGRRIRTYYIPNTTNPAKYVEYILQVKVLPPLNQIQETGPSEFIIFRRYSDFHSLHCKLKNCMTNVSPAIAFPRKHILTKWRRNPNENKIFLDDRERSLSKWFNHILDCQIHRNWRVSRDSYSGFSDMSELNSTVQLVCTFIMNGNC